MKLIVKMYGSLSDQEKVDANVVGIPSDWPAEVASVDDSLVVESPWVEMTEEDLAAHKAAREDAYNVWLATKNLPDISKMIGEKIKKAMDFGKQMMIEYGTKNVMRGYNVDQTRAVAIKLSELQALLMSGSLYCVRQAIMDMVPDVFVTQADKDEFLTKINSYLSP